MHPSIYQSIYLSIHMYICIYVYIYNIYIYIYAYMQGSRVADVRRVQGSRREEQDARWDQVPCRLRVYICSVKSFGIHMCMKSSRVWPHPMSTFLPAPTFPLRPPAPLSNGTSEATREHNRLAGDLPRLEGHLPSQSQSALI